MEKSGWLLKKSRWVGAWRNRYCGTDSSSKEVSFACKVDVKPHITFSLYDVKAVNSIPPNRFGKVNVIHIALVNGQNFFVCAANEQEKTEWITALSKFIGQRNTNASLYNKPKMTAAESEAVCKELYQYTLDNMIRVPYWYCVEDGFVYTFKLGPNKQFVKHNRMNANMLTQKQKEALKRPAFANRSFLTCNDKMGAIFMQFDGIRMHGHLLVFIMPNGKYWGMDDPVLEDSASSATPKVSTSNAVSRVHAQTASSTDSSSSSGDTLPSAIFCLAAELSSPGEPIYNYIEKDAGIYRFCNAYFAGDKNSTKYTGPALSSRQMKIVTGKGTDYSHKLFHIVTPNGGGHPQVLFLLGDRFFGGETWMVLCKTDGSLHKFNEATKTFDPIAPALMDESGESVYCYSEGKVVNIGDETLYNGPPLSKRQLKVMAENPTYKGELFKILINNSGDPNVLFVVGVITTGAVSKCVQMRPCGSMYEFIDGAYKEISGPVADDDVDPNTILYFYVKSEDPTVRGIYDFEYNAKYNGPAKITQRQFQRLADESSEFSHCLFNVIHAGPLTQIFIIKQSEPKAMYNLFWDGSLEKFDYDVDSFKPFLPALPLNPDEVEYRLHPFENHFFEADSEWDVLFDGPKPTVQQVAAMRSLERMTHYNVAVSGQNILIYVLGNPPYRGLRPRLSLVKPDGSVETLTN